MKKPIRNINLSTKEKNVLKLLDAKRNGAYFKIQYLTDCNDRVSTAWKGHNVTKLTTMSVRKGIKYENLRSVIEERMRGDYTPSTRESWYHHIDKMLCKHNKKDQYYVALFPNKFGKPTTMYMLDGMPISKQDLQTKGIMQPSYWKQKEKKPKVFTLGLDKIINVYKKGE